MVVSRGFSGRRRSAPDLPPGQYLTEDFPVLTAGPTPRVAARPVGAHDHHRDRPGAPVGLGRPAGAAVRHADRRPALRHPLVQARHRLAGRRRSTRCSRTSRPPRTSRSSRRTAATRRTCRWRTCSTGRPGWPTGTTARTCDAEHGGPARLLVPHLYLWKSAKWVRGITLSHDRRAGLLGDRRLPQLRRPVARAALLGRVSWTSELAPGDRDRRPARDRRPHAPSSCRCRAGRATRPASTSTSGSPPTTATPRPAPTRSRRLRRGDLVEITVERLDDGEVSPYLVDEVRAGRPARGPRTGRRLVRLAAGTGRAGAAGRRRLGRGAADVDRTPARGWPAAPRRCASCYSVRDPDAMLYRDELAALRADGLDADLRLHPAYAGRLAAAAGPAGRGAAGRRRRSRRRVRPRRTSAARPASSRRWPTCW